jgi:hypothetical protein
MGVWAWELGATSSGFHGKCQGLEAIIEVIIEAIMRASPESCFMRSAHNTKLY